ncbi:hypothetical protein [Marinoscillum pacificum]|uniref:hypothetical protein n=1 Tax=Marinoscillum pacificum TaxID=392723 RepID=UPI00215860EB|nr:hypothetical protein [Marinoscillum pacificum]
MMKKIQQIMLSITLLSYVMSQAIAQEKVDTITLKKGEVFDILLLSRYPNTETDVKSYFETASPVARRMSYQPLPGWYNITKYTQGNHGPEKLILAKWDNMATREAFLDHILNEVEDFHERRRKIWSYFGLRYYEMEEDISFEIHRDQFQVATAFWLEAGELSSDFYEKWLAEISSSGGQILIELSEGKSPFGYQYDPEYFVISSWENKNAFDAFQVKMKQLELDIIQHINEFILE